MPTLTELLQRNRRWAAEMVGLDPGFFQRHANGQEPKYLWIGCSDSRVAGSEILDLEPGELFVHRNIANQVIQTDPNLQAVIQYAVEVLKVSHIMVAGHYGCGGVEAACGSSTHRAVDHWLENIRGICQKHRPELERLPEPERHNRLCELNVLEQVETLRRISSIRNAWETGRRLEIHAWIYRLADGHLLPLRDVITGPEDHE